MNRNIDPGKRRRIRLSGGAAAAVAGVLLLARTGSDGSVESPPTSWDNQPQVAEQLVNCSGDGQGEALPDHIALASAGEARLAGVTGTGEVAVRLSVTTDGFGGLHNEWGISPGSKIALSRDGQNASVASQNGSIVNLQIATAGGNSQIICRPA